MNRGLCAKQAGGVCKPGFQRGISGGSFCNPLAKALDFSLRRSNAARGVAFAQAESEAGNRLCHASSKLKYKEVQNVPLEKPLFNRSLRGKTSMRQVLAWLLRLGRRLGRKKGFPAHWYVYRVLRRRGKHLPVYLRGFLKNHLPHLSYGVINSRLGYLRRAFIKFSVQENVWFD
jgi:hypothetical protein